MTAAAPAAPRATRLVLADRVFSRSVVTDIALIVSGAALTALLAQVAIPMFPVPITGQTLAVLLVGSTMGAWRGAASMVLYAVLGVAGLPVFAPNPDGSHTQGIVALLGATGGYILGFIAAAALVGWLAERSWDRKLLKAFATFIGGSLVVFAVGLPWLGLTLGLTLEQTLAGGLYPFILGGVIKAAIAAVLLPGAWWVADRVKADRSA